MLLREIAAAVLDIQFRTLPAQAVQTAKEGILDTIGVTLAGAHSEDAGPLSRTILNTAGAGPLADLRRQPPDRRPQRRAH